MSKKEQVINTARDLFSELGYRKVSMDEIARVSGVTKRTIYTYFKDKDDLIKYFLYEEINKMKLMTEEIDKKDISFTQKIHENIMMLMEYRTNSKLLNEFSSAHKRLRIADECEEILNQAFQSDIKKKLDLAIEEGHIKQCNTDVVAFVIYKIYVALMFEWDKPLDKKSATERIMNILENGLFV